MVKQHVPFECKYKATLKCVYNRHLPFLSFVKKYIEYVYVVMKARKGGALGCQKN